MARRKHLGDQVFTGVLNIESENLPTFSIDATGTTGTYAYMRFTGRRNAGSSNPIGQIDFNNSQGGSTASQLIALENGDLNLSIGQLKVGGDLVWHAGNDGSGSGLDADTLDGQHASAFALLSGATFTGNVSATGFTGNGGGLTGVNADNLGGQSASSYALLSGATFTGTVNAAQLQVNGADVWHPGNDGAGSGLDADTLDGSHANAFAFLTGATFTGGVTAPSFSGDGSALTDVTASGLSQGVSTFTDNVADANYTGIHLDVNMSGADPLTADRNHWGLYIDVDSSASGGNTAEEHRIYGLYVNTDANADSDLIFGTYSFARARQSTGTVTQLKGAYNYASADNTGGLIASAFGSDNYGVADGVGGQVNNVYGSYNRGSKSLNHDGTVLGVYGVYGEAEINGASGSVSSAYGVRSHIDNNSPSANLANGYLFYGSYAGDTPSTDQYGLYILAPTNYLSGTLAVEGSTSNIVWHAGNFDPASKLDVGGTANNSNSLGGQSASAYALLSGATFTGTINAAQVQWNGSDVFHPGNLATGSDNRNFGGIGIGGASPDAVNRLSANTEAALFNNAGDDIRFTLNKASTGDDASLTLQTGFSTRAQLGLTGNDDLTFKVSPDGSAFFDGIIVDKDTGSVSLPNTAPHKFQLNSSGRVYLYGADDRWICLHDDFYGVNYYQHLESGGTNADPLLEWEHMGEYVREGTIIHDLSMFGRITDTATIEDVEIYVCFVQPNGATPISKWDGNETTGVDADADVTHSILWRGFWKAGTATTGTALNAYSGPVNDQIRRKFQFPAFTAPVDGQLRIYIKPHSVDPRPNTADDYFYQSHSWLLSLQ